MALLLAYIAACSAIDSRSSLCLVFKVLKIFFTITQFLKRCLTGGVLFVPYIREGQSESCYLATQYLTELAVNLIQATFCQKESQFHHS